MAKGRSRQRADPGVGGVTIRAADAADVGAIIALDARITDLKKPDYWADMFARYGGQAKRFFLIAESPGGAIVGFIIGEVRAWEFGSPASGWVFALGVDPDQRQGGIGSRLFKAIRQRLAQSGVDTVRTMLARDDDLNMTFFRSQGMMAGPFIQLEMPLDEDFGDDP